MCVTVMPVSAYTRPLCLVLSKYIDDDYITRWSIMYALRVLRDHHGMRQDVVYRATVYILNDLKLK